jgi:flagellar biosynthesis protein FlhF
METKTYRAPNMLIALQEIQRDLGPNAIVLSMREIASGPAWQVWSKPGVEVVASTEMPSRQNEAAPAGKKSDVEVPGRKDIESILNALSAKNGFTALEPEKIIKTQAEVHPRSHLGTQKEPARWNPPALNSKPAPSIEPRSNNPVVKVLGNLVDEILEDSRSADKKQADMDEGMPPMLKLIQHRLVRQGVDKDLVNHLVETNLRTLSPVVLADENRLQRYMMKQMEASVHPQKNSMAVIQSRVICLVGSTGSGKTSTCAKMAAYYARTLQKKVSWVCADTVRAGAIAETRTFTDALEVPLFFAYTPQELNEVINSLPDMDLILVDTPGINPLDEDRVTELGSFLNEVPARSIYVTTPATTKGVDLIQTVSTFSLFNLKGLIATKMDETYSYGDIYNLLLTTHLPVLYFTNGTQILGKLIQGDPAKLVAAIFGEGFQL